MSEEWVGQTVGTYRIEREIGAGGCGRVYYGVDQMLDRSAAIKVLDPRIASREGAVERFRAEAHTLARLSHANVAALYSLLVEQGAHLMVMEYVEGVTVDTLLRRRRTLPLDEILPIFLQVLDGVEHVHGFGVIHRDLKGANVMLRPDGVAKVLDFGIAAALVSDARGVLQGTPEYMAPEQLRGEEVDERTDLYALGVLLYRALTGRYPLSAPSLEDVIQNPLGRVAPPLRQLVPNVPAAVSDAVQCLLEPDPDKRFANSAELRRALDRRGAGCAVAIDLAADAADNGAPGDRCTEVIEDLSELHGPKRDAEVTESELVATHVAATDSTPRRWPRAVRWVPAWAAIAVLLWLGAGWIFARGTPAAPPKLELPASLPEAESNDPTAAPAPPETALAPEPAPMPTARDKPNRTTVAGPARARTQFKHDRAKPERSEADAPSGWSIRR